MSKKKKINFNSGLKNGLMDLGAMVLLIIVLMWMEQLCWSTKPKKKILKKALPKTLCKCIVLWRYDISYIYKH